MILVKEFPLLFWRWTFLHREYLELAVRAGKPGFYDGYFR